MEILKNLTEEEMDHLRRTFEESNVHRALTPKTFARTLLHASQGKEDLAGRLGNRYLRHLFISIDVAGTGYVSWDDFTMFAIDQARSTELVGGGGGGSLRSQRRHHGHQHGYGGSRSTNRQKEASSPCADEGRSSNATPSLTTSVFARAARRVTAAPARELSPSSSLCSSSLASSVSVSEDEESSGDRSSEAGSDGASSPSAESPDALGTIRTNGNAARKKRRKSKGTQEGGDVLLDEFTTFHEYHVDHIVPQRYGTNVVDIRLLPRVQKMVQVSDDLKGTSSVSVFDLEEQKVALYGVLPRHSEVVTAWEYIPVTGGVRNGNAIACSYNGGLLQLFSLEKKHSVDEVLRSVASIQVSETQTSLLWCSMYGRMMLGSRGGVVSTWDIDDNKFASQEKLHAGPVSGLRVHAGNLLFSASLDNLNSVKAIDLERSVVRYAFHDHLMGGAMCLELDEEFVFSAGFEPKIVQRLLQSPKAHPSYLYDAALPHKGRISALFKVPNSPVLVSGDTRGAVKLWDLRMGMCVQTLTSTALTSVKNRVVAPSGVVTYTEAHRQEGESRERREPRRDSFEAAGKGQDANRRQRQGGMRRVLAGRSYLRNRDKRLAEDYRSEASNALRRVQPRGIPQTGATGAANINAICFLPTHNHLLVATPKEIVALSSDSTACPDLTDDERPCRFILFPGEDQILTVHERGVKLWNLSTGYIVYDSQNHLVPSDISACALVQPLQRQFLLGTMDGEVASFSVSLAQPMLDMSEALREVGVARRGNQILSLYTLAKLRDYPSPYAVVVTSASVELVPMMSTGGCDASHVMPMHGLRASLLAEGATIKDTFLVHHRLYVATSNNSIVLADLQQSGAVSATFRLPSTTAIESVSVGTFAVGPPATATKPNAGAEEGNDSDLPIVTHHAALFFTPENGGKVLVGGTCVAVAPAVGHDAAPGASSSSAPTSPVVPPQLSTVAPPQEHHCVLGEWSAAVPYSDDDLRTPPAGSAVRWRWYRQPSTRRPGAGGWSRDTDGCVERGPLAAAEPVRRSCSHPRSPSQAPSRAASLQRGDAHDNAEVPPDTRKAFSLTTLAQELLPSKRLALMELAAEGSQEGLPRKPSPSRDRTSRVTMARLGAATAAHASLTSVLITHVFCFDADGLVVTGDERGHVRVWDLLGVAQVGASMQEGLRLPQSCAEETVGEGGNRHRAGSCPAALAAQVKPRFVAGWDAHEKGLTALVGMLCPFTGFPVVVTAGVDRRVCLWSTDGSRLGSLAVGRQASEASGGRRYDLDAYDLSRGLSVAELSQRWTGTAEVLAGRVNAFVERSRPSSATTHVSPATRGPSPMGTSVNHVTSADAAARVASAHTPASKVGSVSPHSPSRAFFVTEAPPSAPAPATTSQGAAGTPLFPDEEKLDATAWHPQSRSAQHRLNASTNTNAPTTVGNGLLPAEATQPDTPLSGNHYSDSQGSHDTVLSADGSSALHVSSGTLASASLVAAGNTLRANEASTGARENSSKFPSPLPRVLPITRQNLSRLEGSSLYHKSNQEATLPHQSLGTRNEASDSHIMRAETARLPRHHATPTASSSVTGMDSLPGRRGRTPPHTRLARTGVVPGGQPLPFISPPGLRRARAAAAAPAEVSTQGAEVVAGLSLDRSTTVRNGRRRAKDRAPLTTPLSATGPLKKSPAQCREEAARAMQRLLPSINSVQ